MRTESNSETKSAPINIRVYPSDRDLIDRAAKIVSKNRADFMMESAMSEAKNVILDQTLFSISETDFEHVDKILSAPLNENLGYLKLMNKDIPWEQD